MILDVSVTLKWLITEKSTDKARPLLTRTDLAAPDLIDLELASALTRKARKRIVDNDESRRLRHVHQRMPAERFDRRPFEI